jgi:DNA repair photolyase
VSAPDVSPRPAGGALTRASGFLVGYTHSLNPYTGCRFACSYCYVRGLPVHRYHQPDLPWGDYAHPRAGLPALLEREMARFAKQGTLDRIAILMSSATDPYQPLERRWRLSRACLDVFARYPPGLLNVQTRSPLVEEDYPRLHALGDRCWLNFTLETDLEAVRKAATPRCPPVGARVAALRAARAAGLNVQVTVSPCLPYSDVATFGGLLLELGQRVIVDSFTTGDGARGRRTAETAIPALYDLRQWGDWRAEDAARALHAWLQARLGDRAGWSQAGFSALPLRVTAPDGPGARG